MSLTPSRSASNPQAVKDTVMDLAMSTLGKKLARFKPDDPLFSGQTGFDSFSLMEFVLCLEEAFGIKIPDEDLDPDIFYSVKTIVAYVQHHLEQVS